MPLKTLTFTTIRPLLRAHLTRTEDDAAALLIVSLRPARARKYLTRGELERICRWKSPRALPLIRANSHHQVRSATGTALNARSERVRLESLVRLRGVSIPMASAILTLLDPKRYGVIDIRVWQLLLHLGTVSGNPGGSRFTFAQWYRFLSIIRYFAAEFDVSARDVERTLFVVHQRHQLGNLYRT